MTAFLACEPHHMMLPCTECQQLQIAKLEADLAQARQERDFLTKAYAHLQQERDTLTALLRKYEEKYGQLTD